MSHNWEEAIIKRRSKYALGKEWVVPIERVNEIATSAILHCPTPFNSHSGTIVVIVEDEHNRFWEEVKTILLARVSMEKERATAQKIDAFKQGVGTFLFFEDTDITKDLQTKFPSYKHTFPIWVQHAQGMLQYIVWTSLQSVGFASSLQHYNPLIDSFVQKTWSIPSSWKLTAQMPFGSSLGDPKAKVYPNVDEKCWIIK